MEIKSLGIKQYLSLDHDNLCQIENRKIKSSDNTSFAHCPQKSSFLFLLFVQKHFHARRNGNVGDFILSVCWPTVVAVVLFFF